MGGLYLATTHDTRHTMHNDSVSDSFLMVKGGAFAGVKGSSSSQFSDDRSVLTVHFH
jgi:hypothetical protein